MCCQKWKKKKLWWYPQQQYHIYMYIWILMFDYMDLFLFCAVALPMWTMWSPASVQNNHMAAPCQGARTGTLWNLPEPLSGTCSCDPHRHTPELIWAEDPISLNCWGKKRLYCFCPSQPSHVLPDHRPRRLRRFEGPGRPCRPKRHVFPEMLRLKKINSNGKHLSYNSDKHMDQSLHKLISCNML